MEARLIATGKLLDQMAIVPQAKVVPVNQLR